jgi:hypothetical protein
LVYAKEVFVCAFEGEATRVVLDIAHHVGELPTVGEYAVVVLGSKKRWDTLIRGVTRGH